ncbi:PKD domain-containing protein, partial [Arenibacter lacus]|uniref:PKD domain-containing protein n=1 Tax=Arenibacter lacus TaxID=2608629 RepID=UPI00123CBD63
LELYDVGHVPTGVFQEITVNITDQEVCNSTPFPDSWAVHQLETHSYTAVYTIPDYDLDGDGLKDIVTGGWWYKNPGSASGNWEKKTIGGNFGNVVHVYDFDGDGHMDLLGTEIGVPGKEYQSERLLWAKNDGSGNFTVYNNIPVVNSGYNEPFLAGITGGDFGLGAPYQMAINWNGAESTNFPVQMLTPSTDPTTGTWTLEDISNDPSGEDIKAGDIDGDGRLDLYQGINWLRNEGDGSWTTFPINVGYVTTPDRIQLADFNGNGRLDGVVGQLGLGGNPDRMQLAWFESPEDPTQPWIKHIISSSVSGSLSVSAIDIDFDGDMDIVVGEWLDSKRLIAFENDLCNSGQWIQHILDDGSLGLEHHDSAMVVDIDNDGDLDVVSNGWTKDKGPRIYENTSIPPVGEDPVVNAGADQTIVLPVNSVTLNGTGSDPEGGPVTFLWSQASGPNTATLTGQNTADLTVNDLMVGEYVFRLTVTNSSNNSVFDEVTVTVEEELMALRINGGGPAYNFNSFEWSEDQSFSGGSTLTNNMKIANTSNDQLYQTERYASSGTLIYNIPVTDGTYDLNLHFAEIYFGVPGPGSGGGEGSRVFNIEIENGQGLINDYDIVVAAGGSATAVIEHFKDIAVNDGNLTITLTSTVNFPKISGIEVLLSGGTSLPPIVSAGGDQTISLPTNSIVLDGSAHDPDGGAISTFLWTQISGPNTATLINENTDDLSVSDLIEGVYKFRLTAMDDEGDSASDDVIVTVLKDPVPLRINSGGPDLDYNGELWSADQYFSGGGIHSNNIAIANTENDALYQTERFSSSSFGLTYEIPVVNGKHNLDLHFAEIYFGVPGGGSTGGVGSRVFHIDVENGAARIDNYDIVAAAGGSATAVVESFSNIEVLDGSLTITLIPVTENPKISGIGVVESRSPEVDAGPDQEITLPVNSITQNGTGRDPDGGPVTFLWTQTSGPGPATLINANTPMLTANDLIPGTYVFRLNVTDDENDFSWDEVTVAVVSDNNPPVAIATSDVSSGEAPLTVTFTGSNSTDDVQVTGYEWDFMDGSPLNNDPDPVHTFTTEGVYEVSLTVTDGSLNHTTTIVITVNSPSGNQPPVVANSENQFNNEGETVSLQITASDPEGDNLSYAVTGLPTGLSIDSATGLISGTIADGSAANSPYSVEVTVTDDGSPVESTTITFIWNVSVDGVNQAPTVTSPGEQNNLEGAEISLQISATDPDGDTMDYSAVNLPTGLSIDLTTGL